MPTLFLSVCLLLNACLGESEQKQLISRGFKENVRGMLISDTLSSDIVSNNPEEPLYAIIQEEQLNEKNISLPSDADSKMILTALFPGRVYHERHPFDKSRTLELVRWSSNTQATLRSEYVYYPEASDTLPFTDGTTSLTLMDSIITDTSGRWRFFFFFHSPEITPTFCGRYSGSPTGVAVFRENDQEWRLVTKELVLGSFGSFSTPVLPQIERVNDGHFLFSFKYTNGGPGGVYTGINQIFSFYDDEVMEVLREDWISMSNVDYGSMSTVCSLQSNSDHRFKRFFFVETSGEIRGDQVAEPDEIRSVFSTSPPLFREGLEMSLTSGKRMTFVRTRVFEVRKNQFQLVDEDVNYQLIKDWEEEKITSSSSAVLSLW